MNAECESCGRRYGEENGFPDLVIETSVWRRISPRRDETGLLCPCCILQRLHALGISCAGAFMSGPIETVTRQEMQTIRRIENIEERMDRDEIQKGHGLCSASGRSETTPPTPEAVP